MPKGSRAMYKGPPPINDHEPSISSSDGADSNAQNSAQKSSRTRLQGSFKPARSFVVFPKLERQAPNRGLGTNSSASPKSAAKVVAIKNPTINNVKTALLNPSGDNRTLDDEWTKVRTTSVSNLYLTNKADRH
jgi:hypothetical protein